MQYTFQNRYQILRHLVLPKTPSSINSYSSNWLHYIRKNRKNLIIQIKVHLLDCQQYMIKLIWKIMILDILAWIQLINNSSCNTKSNSIFTSSSLLRLPLISILKMEFKRLLIKISHMEVSPQ